MLENKSKMLVRKFQSKMIKASVFVGTIIGLLTQQVFGTVSAFADTPTPILDYITNNKGNGTFDSLTQTTLDTGASFYNFLLAAGIVGLLLSTIVIGIGIALTHNSSKKGEKKSVLINIAIGGLIIFGAVALVGLVQTIAGKIQFS